MTNDDQLLCANVDAIDRKNFFCDNMGDSVQIWQNRNNYIVDIMSAGYVMRGIGWKVPLS